MTYLFKLAVKNILRSKIRTILTFLILSFGVALYILLACLMAGFDKVSTKNVIDFETGHYKLRSASFDEDHPYNLKNFLKNPQALKNQVLKLGFVTGTAERVQFLAELDNGIDSVPVVSVGIGPQDNQVFSLEQYITEGRLEPGGLLMGKSLAQDMDLQRDDPVYLTSRDQHGMFTSREMLITGIVNSANPQVNNSTVFMSLEDAQNHLNTTQVTDITVKTGAFFKVKEYEPQIKAVVPKLKVYSWKKLSEDFSAMMAMKRKFQGIFLLMIMVIAVVGIVNTMLMSVYEKKIEIGTMKALGFTDQEVSNLFLIEGFLIGLAGGLMGLLLGTLFNSWFYFVGMDITAMMGDQDIGMPIMGVVRSAWIADAYIKALLFATLASIAASYYPARKVTKMEAMECLRTVQ